MECIRTPSPGFHSREAATRGQSEQLTLGLRVPLGAASLRGGYAQREREREQGSPRDSLFNCEVSHMFRIWVSHMRFPHGKGPIWASHMPRCQRSPPRPKGGMTVSCGAQCAASACSRVVSRLWQTGQAGVTNPHQTMLEERLACSLRNVQECCCMATAGGCSLSCSVVHGKSRKSLCSACDCCLPRCRASTSIWRMSKSCAPGGHGGGSGAVPRSASDFHWVLYGRAHVLTDSPCPIRQLEGIESL